MKTIITKVKQGYLFAPVGKSWIGMVVVLTLGVFALGRISTDYVGSVHENILSLTLLSSTVVVIALVFTIAAFSKDLRLMFQNNLSRSSLILDSLPVATFLIDVDGVIRDCNASACTLLEFELHELIDTHFESFVTNAVLDDRHDLFKRLKPDPVVHQEENSCDDIFVLTKSGKKIPAYLVISWRLLDSRNQGIVTLVDKSEKSTLVAAVRESENIQQTMLQNIPYCVIGLGLNGTINLLNQAAQSMFNCTSELMMGVNYSQIPCSPLREFLSNVLNEFKDLRQRAYQIDNLPLPFSDLIDRFDNEQRISRTDGSSFLFSYTLIPVSDGHDKQIGQLIIGYDSSEKRSKDLMINRMLIKLQLATQAADIGVWTWDLATNEIEIDRRIRDLYGIRRKDRRDTISFDFWLSRVHPDDRKQFEQRMQKAKSSVIPFTHTYRIVRTDQSVLHVQTSSVFELNEVSQALRMIGINRDVTEQVEYDQKRKQASDAAVAAVEAKSNFLANMSHEIRTPMNSIIGFTSLLIDSPLSATQKMYLERVQTSSQALLGLLNDILDHTKIEAGKLSFDIAPFDLNKVVEQVSSLFSLRFIEKKLAWRVEIDPKTPMQLMGDSFRLSQVLVNLVDNAIKFTDAGEIMLTIGTVGAGRKNKTLKFSVKDTGTGIPKSSIEQVFNPFFQTDSTISRKYGGTGLGLWIAKQLVNAMDGVLVVESELGKGSEFSFTASFRIAEVEAVVIEGPNQSEFSTAMAASLAIRGAHVLLVDDNRINQQLCQLLLTKLGVTFTAAYDGNQAIDACNTLNFDLILMDLQMPERDGLSAAKEILKQLGNKTPPIVALTAAAMLSDRDEANEAGMVDFLPKPFTVNQLSQILIKWIDPKHLEKQVVHEMNKALI